MRVLVTGGSGFIGRNLIERLCELGHEVLNLDIKKAEAHKPELRWLPVNLLNVEELRTVITSFNPNYVFHLAARTDLTGKNLDDYRVNITGTQNLIRVLCQLKEKPIKTLFFSSRLVFRIDSQPQNDFDYSATTFYGKSKIAMEELIFSSSEDIGRWSVARPTSIWGPWFETPYRDFFEQIKSGRYFHVSGFNPAKSFGYVRNVVEKAITVCIDKPDAYNNEVWWLCDNHPLHVNDWAQSIARNFGNKRILTLPYPVIKGGALVGDLVEKFVGVSFPITSFRLANLITPMIFDTSRNVQLLGADRFTIDEATQQTVNWYEKAEEL